MVKLIEITGKAVSGEWGIEDQNGIGIPVLRTTNFTNEGIINYKDVVTRIISKKNIENKYLKNGDIIIEKSGGSDKQPVGRVVYYDGPEHTYLFNNFTGLLRVKDSNRWYPKYVFYSLYANYRKGGTKPFENRTTGLHNLQIDNYVENFKINEIGENAQREICEKLDLVRLIIRLRDQQLRCLDDLIKAQFVEMFGDPVTNPKHCKKCRLINECDIITGNTPSRNIPQYYGNYIEWIKSDNINTPFSYLTEAIEGLSEEGLKVGRWVDTGSILMTCIAGSIGCIGNVGIANRKVAFNQQINAIIPKDNNTWFMYMQFELSKKYIQSTINMSLKGILSKGQLSELEFIFPPLELQKQFAAFVKQIDRSKVTIQKSLDEMQLLFDSLMQKYFG